MNRADILARVKRGDLPVEDAEVLLEKLERLNNKHQPSLREPPTFKVATKSGWCSVYFSGMWRPCTLPSNLWLELLEPSNVDRFKKFIEENKLFFRNK